MPASVKPGADGILYWTLDGEWLLDANGQKIPVTAQFKIQYKGTEYSVSGTYNR